MSNSKKYYKDTIKKLIPYSDQDFDSLMTSVIDSIPVLTPEYNDVSETDFGMTILEESAKMADVLSWKVDTIMNEALPGNARSRKAALIQSKWLSYKVTQNQASITKEKITLTNDGKPFAVPIGARFATGTADDAIIFETIKGYTFDPPEDVGVDEDYDVFVDIVAGKSTEEYLGVSTGLPNQTFITTKTPYIHGSMYLEVLNEMTNVITVFTEADYMFDIKTGENKFVLRFDENGYGTVSFGDGINGNIPEEQSIILAKYRIGGGERTNLSAAMVNTLVDRFDTRIVAVTNVSDAVGGADEESVASINENAPNALKTGNRLVSTDDCEIWGRSQAGVDDAYFEKDMDYIDLYYLYMLPSDRNTIGLSDEYKAELKTTIDRLCMLGDDIRIKDPIWKDVKIAITVTRDVLYDKDSVESGVFVELKTLIEMKKFGETLSVSDIYSSVREVDGVSKISLSELYKKYSDEGEEDSASIGDIDCEKNEVVRLEYDDDIVITIV